MNKFKAGDTENLKWGQPNKNRQICCGTRGVKGTDHGQVSYRMTCGDCWNQYGSNGSDVFQRKCPDCQDGKPGIPY